MDEVTLWDHLFALTVGLLLPIGGAIQHKKAEPSAEPMPSRHKVTMYWANSVVLGVLAGLALLLWHFDDREWSALGLTLTHERLLLGVVIAELFLILYALDTLYHTSEKRIERTSERWRQSTPFMPANGREVWHSLVMVVSAATFEEVVFRGYLIAYVASFTGSSPLGLVSAVAVPSLVFGLCHLYQGIHAALKITLLAGFVGAIYVVTGSLLIPVLLHFFIDLVGVLLGPRLLRKSA